jgi:hypothetical protein
MQRQFKAGIQQSGECARCRPALLEFGRQEKPVPNGYVGQQ